MTLSAFVKMLTAQIPWPLEPLRPQRSLALTILQQFPCCLFLEPTRDSTCRLVNPGQETSFLIFSQPLRVMIPPG